MDGWCRSTRCGMPNFSAGPDTPAACNSDAPFDLNRDAVTRKSRARRAHVQIAERVGAFDVEQIGNRQSCRTDRRFRHSRLAWLKTATQSRPHALTWIKERAGCAAHSWLMLEQSLLLTDLYQLSMLEAYAAHGMMETAVSRGGRPDMADDALERVAAPTLLIAGGNDPEVLALNRAAYRRLRCERRLEVVAGATHLFEEPGTLEAVVVLARDWFLGHLAAAAEETGHAVSG